MEVLIELGNLWRIVHPNKKLAWMQRVYEVIITLKTILWSEVAKFASLPSGPLNAGINRYSKTDLISGNYQQPVDHQPGVKLRLPFSVQKLEGTTVRFPI